MFFETRFVFSLQLSKIFLFVNIIVTKMIRLIASSIPHTMRIDIHSTVKYSSNQSKHTCHLSRLQLLPNCELMNKYKRATLN